jgi:hypothetical protein
VADTVESTSSSPIARSPLKGVRPKCPHARCGKDFSTVTNLNKHMKYDCRGARGAAKVRFSCRNEGCKRHFSREAYRTKHEGTACKASRGAPTARPVLTRGL